MKIYVRLLITVIVFSACSSNPVINTPAITDEITLPSDAKLIKQVTNKYELQTPDENEPISPQQSINTGICLFTETISTYTSSATTNYYVQALWSAQCSRTTAVKFSGYLSTHSFNFSNRQVIGADIFNGNIGTGIRTFGVTRLFQLGPVYCAYFYAKTAGTTGTTFDVNSAGNPSCIAI